LALDTAFFAAGSDFLGALLAGFFGSSCAVFFPAAFRGVDSPTFAEPAEVFSAFLPAGFSGFEGAGFSPLTFFALTEDFASFEGFAEEAFAFASSVEFFLAFAISYAS
jgi:hypothetical protein